MGLNLSVVTITPAAQVDADVLAEIVGAPVVPRAPPHGTERNRIATIGRVGTTSAIWSRLLAASLLHDPDGVLSQRFLARYASARIVVAEVNSDLDSYAYAVFEHGERRRYVSGGADPHDQRIDEGAWLEEEQRVLARFPHQGFGNDLMFFVSDPDWPRSAKADPIESIPIDAMGLHFIEELLKSPLGDVFSDSDPAIEGREVLEIGEPRPHRILSVAGAPEVIEPDVDQVLAALARLRPDPTSFVRLHLHGPLSRAQLIARYQGSRLRVEALTGEGRFVAESRDGVLALDDLWPIFQAFYRDGERTTAVRWLRV